MQSVYKSVVTNILCISQEVTEAKHIIIITVHLFVLIQWASQQVSQPPTLSWAVAGLLNQLENVVPHIVSVRPQTQRAQTNVSLLLVDCFGR